MWQPNQKIFPTKQGLTIKNTFSWCYLFFSQAKKNKKTPVKIQLGVLQVSNSLQKLILQVIVLT